MRISDWSSDVCSSDLARFLVAARLLAPDSQVPGGAACMALVHACGYDSWDNLAAGLLAARAQIAAAWPEPFGETLELADRQSDVSGKIVSVCVEHSGRRII